VTLAYVALGGTLGALARYGISGWVYDRMGENFPWGTLLVNLVGCLALGLVIRRLQGKGTAALTVPIRGCPCIKRSCRCSVNMAAPARPLCRG
jgi:fluoride ion exporter CrcB/FEX